MNIYISGSLAYDRIMDFPGRFVEHILPEKLHILNVCFTVNSLQEKFGGTAGNIAYSLSLLGEQPIIIATIGKDYEPYFTWLRLNNISTDAIKVIDSEFTAGAYITTDLADNQITGFNPGSMKHTTDYEFHRSDGLMIISAGNLTDMAKYASKCRAIGMEFICDPGQSLTSWKGQDLSDWIKGCKILIVNDYEFELVMRMTGLSKSGLLQLASNIIVTLGEKGSVIISQDSEIEIPPARPIEVKDPTGAGDAYRAGLIKGLCMGKDLVESAKMGSVAALYAIENYGTQEHRYSFEEFMQRFKENYG